MPLPPPCSWLEKLKVFLPKSLCLQFLPFRSICVSSICGCTREYKAFQALNNRFGELDWFREVMGVGGGRLLEPLFICPFSVTPVCVAENRYWKHKSYMRTQDWPHQALNLHTIDHDFNPLSYYKIVALAIISIWQAWFFWVSLAMLLWRVRCIHIQYLNCINPF